MVRKVKGRQQHPRRVVLVKEERQDSDVEEIGRCPAPGAERAVAPQAPDSSVDCPICQGSFSRAEIEVHAAYCDGEQRRPEADCFQGDPDCG